MGNRTLLLINNDCLADYEKHAAEFMREVCLRAGTGDDTGSREFHNLDPYIRVGNGATAEIVKVAHTNDITLILMGHGSAWPIHTINNDSVDLNDLSNRIGIIKRILQYFGYNLVKLPK